MGNTTTKKHYSRTLSSSGNLPKRTRWDGTTLPAGLPAPPGKPILIPGTEDTQPDVVAIRWERSANNGGSAIVGYLVEYRRLGSPNWIRSPAGLCVFPEMTLSGLEPGWRYQFRVRAQNAVGISLPSEISDPLTVSLQRAVASPPQFDLELQDLVALENEQAEFVVRFSGTPLPKISWFKDGFEIFSSRRTRIVTDNGKSVLLIHQTAVNDEGEIKCTATNRSGHASTKAKLTLEALPKIRLPRQYEDGLLFEQDETIRLKVSLAGRPPPVVNWFHDGEPLSQDSRHIFESMDGESVLKIPDAKRFDRGEYTIKAVNKLGEDVTSFLVTVTDRPAAPGKVAVTMTLGRTVTLSWEEPVDDGGCKIGAYIVEYYRIGWDVWLKATTSRKTTATLTELLEGSEYRFRVKAENPYGISDPSEESDVIFIPASKKGTTSPRLSEKSQSQREIGRSRAERHEVNFASDSGQRSRSLTREDRLSMSTYPEKPSRSDSRVTFAPDTLIKREESPEELHRSAEKYRTRNSLTKQETVTPTANIEDVIQAKEKVILPKSTPNPTVTVSPPVVNEQTPSGFDSLKRSSLSPLSSPKIQENRGKENFTFEPLLIKSNPTWKEQSSVAEEETSKEPQSPPWLREEDENALHGSSEFMLVLYPAEKKDAKSLNETERTSTLEMDDEDLIAPPMSLSLPELFSAEHEIIENMRQAVSSTELLHERAMERFYRAMEAEKESLERRTGEVATAKREITLENGNDRSKRSPLWRKLSNSGITMQNLVVPRQMKKLRRRLSEGQAETDYKAAKLLSPLLLPDVEARSDPNLPRESEETAITLNWRRDSNEEAIERLRRWHDSNLPLVEKKEEKKEEGEPTSWDNEEEKTQPEEQTQRLPMEMREERQEEAVITSEESSEEISSADSEDLRSFKQRILASQAIEEEEETYHPRGRPLLALTPEPMNSPYSYESSSETFYSEDSTSPDFVRPVAPVSPTNILPKSILKKPKEESSEKAKATPPEKPIRRNLPQKEEEQEMDAMKPGAMSESDTDSVLSAGEAAKNRRIQAKTRSVTPEEEMKEANDIEERMALVSHYTEIVRAHSSHRASEERKVTTVERDAEEKQRPVAQDKQTTPVATTREKKQQRSRGTTPMRDGERSRSSSKTRARAPSRDRTSNVPRSRTASVERSTRRSKPPSRSSSRDRQRASTPVEVKMERLRRALESKRIEVNNEVVAGVDQTRLSLEARKNVRSTISYVTDLTLLATAVYIYLFKKETLAIPFIALLLYRRIQYEIRGRVQRRWL